MVLDYSTLSYSFWDNSIILPISFYFIFVDWLTRVDFSLITQSFLIDIGSVFQTLKWSSGKVLKCWHYLKVISEKSESSLNTFSFIPNPQHHINTIFYPFCPHRVSFIHSHCSYPGLGPDRFSLRHWNQLLSGLMNSRLQSIPLITDKCPLQLYKIISISPQFLAHTFPVKMFQLSCPAFKAPQSIFSPLSITNNILKVTRWHFRSGHGLQLYSHTVSYVWNETSLLFTLVIQHKCHLHSLYPLYSFSREFYYSFTY